MLGHALDLPVVGVHLDVKIVRMTLGYTMTYNDAHHDTSTDCCTNEAASASQETSAELRHISHLALELQLNEVCKLMHMVVDQNSFIPGMAILNDEPLANSMFIDDRWQS